jgi:hypothetical protein
METIQLLKSELWKAVAIDDGRESIYYLQRLSELCQDRTSFTNVFKTVLFTSSASGSVNILSRLMSIQTKLWQQYIKPNLARMLVLAMNNNHENVLALITPTMTHDIAAASLYMFAKEKTPATLKWLHDRGLMSTREITQTFRDGRLMYYLSASADKTKMLKFALDVVDKQHVFATDDNVASTDDNDVTDIHKLPVRSTLVHGVCLLHAANVGAIDNVRLFLERRAFIAVCNQVGALFKTDLSRRHKNHQAIAELLVYYGHTVCWFPFALLKLIKSYI